MPSWRDAEVAELGATPAQTIPTSGGGISMPAKLTRQEVDEIATQLIVDVYSEKGTTGLTELQRDFLVILQHLDRLREIGLKYHTS